VIGSRDANAMIGDDMSVADGRRRRITDCYRWIIPVPAEDRELMMNSREKRMSIWRDPPLSYIPDFRTTRKELSQRK
jgi:hypothetical protein